MLWKRLKSEIDKSYERKEIMRTETRQEAQLSVG